MKSKAEDREMVLEIMGYMPEAMRISDIAHSFRRSEQHVRAAVNDLIQQGLVSKKGSGKASRYGLNEHFKNGIEQLQVSTLPFSIEKG
jgi:predicted transcriptional regulator